MPSGAAATPTNAAALSLPAHAGGSEPEPAAVSTDDAARGTHVGDEDRVQKASGMLGTLKDKVSEGMSTSAAAGATLVTSLASAAKQKLADSAPSTTAAKSEVAEEKEGEGKEDDPRPPAFDPPDTLQDPRVVASSRVPHSREFEMQELPPERDRAVGLGHDSNSRLRKLQAELERVIQLHDQGNVSVQSWGVWLLQFCTLGNILQAVCASVMVVSLLFSTVHYKVTMSLALALCGSLCLQLWVQHVAFQQRCMVLCSRARRFLSRLEWYIKNPLEASGIGKQVAGGANVWVQTSRPISAVQVMSDKGRIALPVQLLVSGDRVVGPADHWLINQYCERSELNESTVRTTPSATQLSKVLSMPRRLQTQFEGQAKVVTRMLQWTMLCALAVSISSSVILLILYPGSTFRDTLHLLLVRHVPVVMPLLPISVFLSSVVLHAACDAYLAAKIHHKYSMHNGSGAPIDALLSDFGEDASAPQEKSGWGGALWFLSALWKKVRGRSGIGEGGEADNVPMMRSSDADADPRANAMRKGAGSLRCSSVLAHLLQRFRVPRVDQDRAVAAGVINPCAGLIDALGSATVVCFPDVDGIVCEPLLSPKQILLLSHDHKASGDQSASCVSVIELLGAEKGAPCGACTFQDAGAIERYLSQLKPLGLNCLLNTNAHSDTYTTFIECTLRELVHTRQFESEVGSLLAGVSGALPPKPGVARSVPPGGGGGGGCSGSGGVGGEWIRGDPYVDMVSCDSCDASFLLAPVIGFSQGVATTFNRLLELQILVRPSSAKVLENQQQRRASSACGTPGGVGRVVGSSGGGASPAATSFLMSQRPSLSLDRQGSDDPAMAAAAFGVTPSGSGFLATPSIQGSDGGGGVEARASSRTRCEQRPHLMGVVVEDSVKQLQLFTKGDVDSVLDQCTMVWDGQELRPLSAEDVKLVLRHCSECYQKHYRCVALSYVSLSPDKREAIQTCTQLGRCVFLDQNEMGGLTMLGASDWELPPGAGCEPAVEPMAYSFRRPKTQPASTLSSISEEFLKEHIFIGMLTMRHRPYSEITEAMDILSEAGIRFVFFSEMQEQPTVALGNQLGLWSDWNCCISLRDLPPPPRSIPPSPPGSGISGRSNAHRINANYSHASGPRLPHGIRSIRRHIMEADDVPLRVSMFCNASPETITSMVSILQENGECVVSCGSSRNVHNTQLFACADLSMSIAPQPPSRHYFPAHRKGGAGGWGGMHAELPDAVTSVPCALNMNRHFSMEELIEYISTSRTLLDALRQALQYCLCISLLVMATALMSNVLMLPQALEPLQIICHTVLIAPCFACAILLSVQRMSTRVKACNSMRQKLLRGNNNAKFWKRPEMRRKALYIMIRFVPTSFVLICVFVDCLSISLQRYQDQVLSAETTDGGAGEGLEAFKAHSRWSFMNTLQLSAYSETHQLSTAQCPEGKGPCFVDVFNLALMEARQMTDIMLVESMAVLCIGSLHRTASLLDLWRHCKYIWFGAVAAAATLQSLISAVSMQQSYSGLKPTILHVPPSVIVLVTVWPFAIFFVDEAIRHHDRKKVRRLQQRLTLEFETLLGQTSPK